MATVYNTTFQLRRGNAEVWNRNNPVLARGEPGFVIDENRLKIGDGVTPWQELEYINEDYVFNAKTHLDFPLSGRTNVIYKAEEEKKLYQWNSSKSIYEPLTDGSVEEIQKDIDFIKENYLSQKEFSQTAQLVKYEISHKPEGTIVNYYDKEIRVLCPKDTKWEKQSVGSQGNANMYYMGFKAYAPDNAVSFKEGDRGIIIDEVYTFDDDFAGIDEYGRKFSICWFALASYDESADKWTYFGANSTYKKYLGWDYVVEWYDENNVIISSDHIRINLSNENCHDSVEPYYMNSIDVNKLTQKEDEYLIIYGGSATDNI